MGGHWNSVEEYEELHGTQKQQALAQVVKASAVDGPWKLVREVTAFDYKKGIFVRRTLVLDNSVRSTRSEADWLKDREYERTNIVWSIVRYE
jgi:hypothetical protein